MIAPNITEVGRRAFAAGLTAKDCPFAIRSDARSWWMKGYREAREAKVREAAAERLLYPPTVITYNAPHSDGTTPVEVPYSCYLDAVANRKVGDVVRAYAGAPGTGYRDDRITRIDETGVYAVLVKSTMRILDPSEVA